MIKYFFHFPYHTCSFVNCDLRLLQACIPWYIFIGTAMKGMYTLGTALCVCIAWLVLTTGARVSGLIAHALVHVYLLVYVAFYACFSLSHAWQVEWSWFIFINQSPSYICLPVSICICTDVITNCCCLFTVVLSEVTQSEERVFNCYHECWRGTVLWVFVIAYAAQVGNLICIQFEPWFRHLLPIVMWDDGVCYCLSWTEVFLCFENMQLATACKRKQSWLATVNVCRLFLFGFTM